MQYKFPVIENIEQVLPAIAEKPEFIVAEREGYKVVNYMVNKADTFPEVTDTNSAILRECRGIVFDANGDVLSRRYHKFFNCSERQETHSSKIDLAAQHHILDKADGSMITPLVLDGTVYWATKMGVTDISAQVDDWVSVNTHYRNFARICYEEGVTPIFEWCSLHNRIVIKYDTPRLILTGMRHNVSGEYVEYDDMVAFAKGFGVTDVIQSFSSATDIDELIQTARELEGVEGFVVRFADGHMVKLKADKYVAIHKTKDLFLHPRHIVNLFYTETIDDSLPIMEEADRDQALRILAVFHQGVHALSMTAKQYANRYQGLEDANKKFALSEDSKNAGVLSSLVHKALREGQVRLDDVYSLVGKQIGTNIQFDTFVKQYMPDFYDRIK